MPTYVMLSTLTAEGGTTLHQNPDRLRATNDEIRTSGCQINAQYALMLGEYDFLTVLEAPDEETITNLSADLGSRGMMTITTLPATTMDARLSSLTSPEQLGPATRTEPSREPVGASAPSSSDEPPSLARFID
jgi:uncharacterized protein with GYD domain